MKFLVDAQLPRRLCAWLNDAGHDARHTLELAHGNRTSDAAIVDIALREQRIVVTKDADFVRSHLIFNRPEKLLLIATGNIGNTALEALLQNNLNALEHALIDGCFVEIGRDMLIVHG